MKKGSSKYASVCSIDDCEKPSRCLGFCGMHYNRFHRHGDPQRTHHGEGNRWLIDHASYAGDDCLKWPFGDAANGYGTSTFNGQLMRASRAMCFVAHGQPPFSGAEAAHSCGNGRLGCVNQRHLSWKDRKGNIDDMRRHGTFIRGEAKVNSKLTEDDVRKIKTAFLTEKFSFHGLARRFGVSASSISQIYHGRSWTFVTVIAAAQARREAA